MDEPDDEAIPTTVGDAEINQLIGLFDLPAFCPAGPGSRILAQADA